MLEFTPAAARTWSILGSAGTFGLAATDLPLMDDRALVVTADLRNFSGLDRFAATFPDRLINVGIAEQNLVGIAAGLASEGFTVFATTYATFASARAADPVRVNMGYMGLGVKLVGLGAGFSVGVLGPTHISTEDVAIMRAIPNMAVICPADCTETVKATRALLDHEGPAYLRLGGGVPHPIVYRSDYEFQIGKGIELRTGNDVALIASGGAVHPALQAAEVLAEGGVSATVVDMHTVKPLDTALLSDVFARCPLVVTVEEHSIIGGLGAAVAEFRAPLWGAPPQLILGIPDKYPHAGDYRHLMQQAGLTADSIAARVLAALEAPARVPATGQVG